MKTVKKTGLSFAVKFSIGYLALLCSCGGTKVLLCPPNNEPVMVQRNPDKQFRTYVKTTTTNIKATIEVIDKIKIADLDAGTKGQLTELRTKLDNYSSRVQDILKASYDALSTTPCDPNVRSSHSQLIAEMSKENNALETLKTQLNVVASVGNAAGIDDDKVKQVLGQYNSNNGEKVFK